jgi:pilus assembly protein CpaB
MKSKHILILALIMALITSLLFSQYLKNLDKKYKKNQNKINVIVAVMDISKNQKVTKEMLQIKSLPAEVVLPKAVLKMEDIEGKYALIDIKAGEMLFTDRFTDQYEETEQITRKIREGYRAVSVEVNYIESVSTLVQPEDYVDVVFTEKIKQTGTNEIVNTTSLLQDVRVLAVGKRISQNKAAGSNSKSTDSTKSSSSTMLSATRLSVSTRSSPRSSSSITRSTVLFSV